MCECYISLRHFCRGSNILNKKCRCTRNSKLTNTVTARLTATVARCSHMLTWSVSHWWCSNNKCTTWQIFAQLNGMVSVIGEIHFASGSLWSSRQSSWLQIHRSGFDSRRYQIIWEVVGLERGPLSLVSKTEDLLGRKNSGWDLENREYGCRGSVMLTTWHPRYVRVGTN
jgi:hypothetical protein